jgi:hypothetical protein
VEDGPMISKTPSPVPKPCNPSLGLLFSLREQWSVREKEAFLVH